MSCTLSYPRRTKAIRKNGLKSAYGTALVLGLELSIGVVIFAYIGLKIDRWLSITVFVIVLPILALTAGILRMYWKLKKYL